MADAYKVSQTDMKAVADAIRAKAGTSASLSFPTGFVNAIGNISGGSTPKLVHLTINYPIEVEDNRDNFCVYGTFADENGQIVTGQWSPASGDDIFMPFDGYTAIIVVEYYPDGDYDWVQNYVTGTYGDMEGSSLGGFNEISVYLMYPSVGEQDVYEVALDVACEYGSGW